MTSSPSQEMCSLPRKGKSGEQGTQPRCSSEGWRNFRGQSRGLQPVLRGEEKFGKHHPPPKVSSFDAFYFNFQVSSEFFLWETHTSTPITPALLTSGCLVVHHESPLPASQKADSSLSMVL